MLQKATILLTFFLLSLCSHAQSYLVNTTDDINDGNCDSVHCSLREAINAANADGLASIISFQIDNASPNYTITLLSALPAISADSLIIDATTQLNNNPYNEQISIDGNNTVNNGLSIESSAVELYGLKIMRFTQDGIYANAVSPGSILTIGAPNKGNTIIQNGNNGVIINNFENINIKANYIGTNISFDANLGNTNNGIYINNTTGATTIGGNSNNGNFLCSNNTGIRIETEGSAMVKGNRIGTNDSDTTILYNTSGLVFGDGTKLGSLLLGSNGSINYANTIGFNQIGVQVLSSNNHNFRYNRFICNANAIDIAPAFDYTLPNITNGVETIIVGTSAPSDTIRIYTIDDSACEGVACQGANYIGTVMASASGNWQFPGFYLFGTQFVVTATGTDGRTSDFSNCIIICPVSFSTIADGEGDYCEHDTIYLSSSSNVYGFQWVTMFGDDDISYEWTGPNGYYSTLQNPVDAINPGTYYVQADLMGCKSNLDSVEIGITIVEASAANDGPYCLEEEFHLYGTTPSTGQNIEYRWVGPDNYVSTDQNPDVAQSGIYMLIVSIDDCVSDTALTEIVNETPPPLSLGNDQSICEGDSVSFSTLDYDYYEWTPQIESNCSGCNTFTVSPTVTTTYILAAGPHVDCLQFDTITVNVLYHTQTTEDIILCEGDSIYLFGDTITQTGVYSAAFTVNNGCDSIHTVTVGLGVVENTNETITICEGESAIIFGNTEQNAGIYAQTFSSIIGCDSTHTVTLIVNDSTVTTEYISICAGEEALIFGNPASSSGTYSQNFTNNLGCDSTHFIYLEILDTSFTTEIVTICAGEEALIFGALQSNPGSYQELFSNIYACDSTHIVDLVVLQPIFTEETLSFCEGEEIIIFGNLIQQAGTYTQLYTSQAGCDSTHTIILSMNMEAFTEENIAICEGDSIDVFGAIINSAGTYQGNFATSQGCDSIHTIYLDVLENNTIENRMTCADTPVLIFGEEQDETGTYSMTFAASNGCDSVHTIFLEVYPVQNINEQFFICDGELTNIFGVPTAIAGTYTDTFPSVMGCDSIHTITLTVHPTYNNFEQINICQGEEIIIFGQPISQTGIYEEEYTSVDGCDSIYTIALNVLEPITTFATMQICEGEQIDIFGDMIAISGTYDATFTAANGCDSVHFITLVVENSIESIEQLNTCSNVPVLIFGEWQSQTGTFQHIFTAANGCDSLHTINLEVAETINTQEVISICDGESVSIFDEVVSIPGEYESATISSNGCDSVHTITLVILELQMTESSLSICEGDSMLVFDEYRSQSGTYTQTFVGQNGCDSTHSITVDVVTAVETEEDVVLCNGESIEIFNQLVSTEGIYEATFISTNGCDSTHYINLTISDVITVEEVAFICPLDSILIFNNYESLAGVYSQIFTSANSGCDSIHTVEVILYDALEAQLTSRPTCYGEFSGSVDAQISGGTFPYTYTWNISGENTAQIDNLAAGTYEVTISDANNCVLVENAVIEERSPMLVNTQIEDVSCFGYADGLLTLEVPEEGWQFSIDGQHYDTALEFTDLDAGNYTLYVQDIYDCTLDQPFTINEPAPISVALPEDMTIHLGEHLNIPSFVQNTSLHTITYEWGDDPSILDCKDCPEIDVQPLENTLYSLTIYDENNCEASDEILVRVDRRERVYIPNAFSPDNNNVNDVFLIYAPEESVTIISTFRIFDRWGELVFETSNIPPNQEAFGWDGTFRGQKLSTGVFVYYAEVELIDGSKEFFKGDVTLFR